MAEFFLELLSEEMPATVQMDASDKLVQIVCDELKASGLTFGDISSFVTPRRLVVVVDSLPLQNTIPQSEKRGPRVGANAAAVNGFATSIGIAPDELEQRETKKGKFYFAILDERQLDTVDLIAEMVPRALVRIPWLKTMRWGNGEFRWVRPLRNILCLFNDSVVPLTINELSADRTTVGHRVHSPQTIEVSNFAEYKEKLLAAHVMLDVRDRKQTIVDEACRLSGLVGLRVPHVESLLSEICGLVEGPVVLMGEIDEQYMSLPDEVLTATLRNHQRYMVMETEEGRIAPHFLVVANVESADGGATIIAGNERVLRARLSDARYFWDEDRKMALSHRVSGLSQVVFHTKLGTLDQKVERLEKLVLSLSQQLPYVDTSQVIRAAHLCKADLVTEMVNEFPELQGIMGGYYALADGEDKAVAEAIAEHYSPQGPSDNCPQSPTSVLVALADKIDNLVGFFAIGERPTGSRDPFALRRAALGIIRLIIENGLRIRLAPLLWEAIELYPHKDPYERTGDPLGLLAFFSDRLKIYLRNRDVSYDLINATFSLTGEDDLVRVLSRVEALNVFLDTEDGSNLLTAFKRVNNIVEIEQGEHNTLYKGADINEALFVEVEERNLFQHLNKVSADVKESISKERFSDAFRCLAGLRRLIDDFFDNVTVNAEDMEVRENRLRLLDFIRQQFFLLADFGAIEG